MKFYILYDGRAMDDTFEASVLEAVGKTRRCVRDALHFWRGHDAVLVEYDADGSNLTNERIIGHIREGRKTLLSRLAV